MDINRSITSHEWHIPRPSLGGSSASGSVSDGRSRGGSASSQGSASNHSTHSVSSGSLLLSAAHLARMHGRHERDGTNGRARGAHLARMHGRHERDGTNGRARGAHLARMHGRHERDGTNGRARGAADAVLAIPEESVAPSDRSDSMWNGIKRSSASARDATSTASSTHFTVVNGYTKHRTDKEPTSCCCSHSHQITVLVVSMTILFSACILAAICFVEMRMRKETGVYKYS